MPGSFMCRKCGVVVPIKPLEQPYDVDFMCRECRETKG